MSRRWTTVGLCILFLYVPFLSQAIHIDDRIYLEIAGNLLERPFFPYSYAPLFEGLRSPDAASHSHLPLTAYYLALLKLVGVEAEWVLHMAFLVFPWLAGLAFHDLARRFTNCAEAATVMLLGAPSFLTLGHTLMPDVPLLSLWLLTLSRFLRVVTGEGTRRDRVVLLLALLGASFISLLSAGLLLLMGAYLLLAGPGEERRGSRTFLIALMAAPLLLWFAWYLRAYLYYDRFVLINTLLHMEQRQVHDWTLIGTKAVCFVLNLGALFVFPLALWWGLAGRFRTRIGLLVLLMSPLPFFLRFPDWDWIYVLLFSVFFSSGFLVLWEVVVLIRDRQPLNLLLVFWFLGILAACLTLFYSGSARYTLLAAPPVILFWIRRIETSVSSLPVRRILLWLGVSLTVGLGLLVATADYRFAGSYRVVAEQLNDRFGEPGRRVWHAGEWGFRYYMEKHGAQPLARDSLAASPGDILIKPYVAMPWVTLNDGGEYSELLEQRRLQERYPVRILDFSTFAGFYSSGWGVLPFSFSRGQKWEWFNIYRVKRAYDGPIPQEERHW